jgi:hypothetical protein
MARQSADRPSVFLRVTTVGLVPCSAYDAEQIARFGMGSTVEAILHEPQSEKQARLLWRIVGIVADNTDDYPNADALMLALKIRLAHADSVSLLGGGLHLNPRSLKELDREGLSRFFDRAMEVISSEVIPGLDIKKLVKDGLISIGER